MIKNENKTMIRYTNSDIIEREYLFIHIKFVAVSRKTNVELSWFFRDSRFLHPDYFWCSLVFSGFFV